MDIGSELLDFLYNEINWTPFFSRRPGTIACIPSIESVVGNQIHYFRMRMEMTQQELAERLNVDPSTVSRHERGENLKLEHLTDYARVFGINEYELIRIDKDDSTFSETVRRFQLLHNLSNEELYKALDAVETILQMGQKEVLDE